MIKSLQSVNLNVEEKRQDQDIYLLVGASQQRLEQEAEKMELPMKLHEEFGGGYDEFRRNAISKFQPYDSDNLFSSLQRQYIVKTIMQNEIVDGGADLGNWISNSKYS